MSLRAHGFDWDRFTGSHNALKWNRRDLYALDAVIETTPGRTCVVQAGGNLGIWPKRLAQFFQTVYTFEPAPDLFARMQVNAPEPHILRYQAALGVDRGLVGVSRVRRDTKPDPHEGITHVSGPGVIPTLRIDDLALPVCDLICLDVEGYELFALQGAVETIARCRPVVSVEVNKNAAFLGQTKAQVREYVAGLGYVHVARWASDDCWCPEERAA